MDPLKGIILSQYEWGELKTFIYDVAEVDPDDADMQCKFCDMYVPEIGHLSDCIHVQAIRLRNKYAK